MKRMVVFWWYLETEFLFRALSVGGGFPVKDRYVQWNMSNGTLNGDTAGGLTKIYATSWSVSAACNGWLPSNMVSSAAIQTAAQNSTLRFSYRCIIKFLHWSLDKLHNFTSNCITIGLAKTNFHKLSHLNCFGCQGHREVSLDFWYPV